LAQALDRPSSHSLRSGSMKILITPESRLKLAEALRLMSQALGLLDELDCTGEIDSHLDLAICRLERQLGLHHEDSLRPLGTLAAVDLEPGTAAPADLKPCAWGTEPI
jgi:hypothetical protein